MTSLKNDIDAMAPTSFESTFNTRPAHAARILVVTITLVFGLELWLGEGDVPIPVLGRLGALMRDRVLAGEIWRLVSSSFLHAGFLHFVLNASTLLAIGTPLEKLLGTTRFVVLYAVATLGSGLVALAFGQTPLAVGASGGLFGLLGAEVVMVLTRRGDFLPLDVRARWRRNVFINGSANIAISFLPTVSLSGHLGGAALGAVLAAVGLVPTVSQPVVTKTPFWLRAMAFASGSTLIIGLVAGIAASNALELARTPRLERIRVPELGISAELPTGLSLPPSSPRRDHSAVRFGNPRLDPVSIGISLIAFPTLLAESQLSQQLETIRAELSSASGHGTLWFIGNRRIGECSALLARYRHDRGVIVDTFVLLEPTHQLRVDVIAFDAWSDDYEGLAERIVRSIE